MKVDDARPITVMGPEEGEEDDGVALITEDGLFLSSDTLGTLGITWHELAKILDLPEVEAAVDHLRFSFP